MITTGIICNIMYLTELQNKVKVALHTLKGFSVFFSSRFICNSFREFQNKRHASKGVYL